MAASICSLLGAQSGGKLAQLEREFEAARADYLEQLSDYLPDAYLEHLTELSDRDLAFVANTRRLWHWYIDSGPHCMGDPRKQSTGIFRQEFLDPINRVADILLIHPTQLEDVGIRKARSKAFKLGEKLAAARQRAGVDIDPTAHQKAPTGLAYPRLDKPHTCVDALRLFERTMVLARTVAHPEAETVLMKNAAACAEVDLFEADFVMYANQVRMLTGSIAWVCDPLMTACCRDHSADRKSGKASGHQSKIPDKKWPADRARRFGCRSGPEGAGGGRTGQGAIRGFAYNGTGHGGPLFARLRNVVGPGSRDGCLTAMYQTDDRHKHACQATDGELCLPPGVNEKMLDDGNHAIFKALAAGKLKRVATLLENRRPEDPIDRAVRRYLSARFDAEIDWTLTGIEHILAAGDVFEANERLAQAQKAMAGITAFDKRARKLAARLAKRPVRDEIKVGAAYQKIIGAKKLDRAKLSKFAARHEGSAYVAAARHCLEADGKAFWPELFYFVMQDTHLNKWAYLQKARTGGRN